jgi:hypothetical protein
MLLQEVFVPPAPLAPPQMTILDTPNPLYEVETVAREILKLQQEGVALDEIALLVRQPDALAETLAVIFARYEIPLQGEVGLPLERSWRVRWLMDGIRLLMGVGVGADWLHWLEHPAHRLDYATLRPLHRLRRHQSARSWLDAALTRAEDPNLHRLLQRLHEWRQGLPASLPQVARRLILHLGAPTQESDLAEWLQLVDAYARQWRRRGATEATNLLERLVSGARYTHRLGTSGVRLLPMEHADLVETQVAFALQVLEGTLPRRCPDDPFLREGERNALNAALGAQGVWLPTRADAQAAEPMLFQRILHSARERLYFSYPRTQGGDSDALPSFYLETLVPSERSPTTMERSPTTIGKVSNDDGKVSNDDRKVSNDDRKVSNDIGKVSLVDRGVFGEGLHTLLQPRSHHARARRRAAPLRPVAARADAVHRAAADTASSRPPRSPCRP